MMPVLVVGGLAGVLYTASPLGVWCLVWIAALVRWVARDAAGRERRWLLAALGLAITLRAIAIGALPFLVDPARQTFASYFEDAHYAIQRSIWIRNVFLGIPLATRDYIGAFEPQYGWSGYNYVLAYLHLLFGASPYGVALLSTAIFLTAAAIVYRVCARAFGRLAALSGFLVLLFLPTWFAWSVVPLKEAIQFLMLAAAAAAAIALCRERGRAQVGAVVIIAGAALVTSTLRSGAAPVLGLGVSAGIALWLLSRHRWAAVGLALAMPVLVVVASNQPRVRAFTTAIVEEGAKRHLGHVRTAGFSYKILDAEDYASSAYGGDESRGMDLGVKKTARYLIRATVGFLLMPLPWLLDSTRWLVIVPIQVVWYVALALSAAGVVAGLRRDPLSTCVLAGVVAAGVAIIAPNSGSVATLIRHRDMIVPFVVALAGLGAMTTVERVVTQHD
jgi:hypothetical protein